MIPGLLGQAAPHSFPAETEPSVLVVVRDSAARFATASDLLDAGFTVTAAGQYGVVELMLGAEFDLLVTTQSADDMGHFGVPQLARSICPDLPILVLDIDAAAGAGMIAAVQDAIERWPTRERSVRQYH